MAYLSNEHIFTNGDFKGIDLNKLQPTRYVCGKCKKIVNSVTRVTRYGMHITDACEDCIKGDAKAREQRANYLGK